VQDVKLHNEDILVFILG